METNDSNLKPQTTGGLKLMTVFVFVLALHVVVIGSMCGYYLLKGPSPDADLLSDKMHKSLKVTPDGALVSDAQTPDTGDKTASPSSAAPSPADTASSAPAPAADGTPAPVSTPASTTLAGAGSTAPASAAPAVTAPSPVPATTTTTTAAPPPATTLALATPVTATTIVSTSTQPSGPIQSEPGINITSTPAPAAPVVADAPTPATSGQLAPPVDGTPYVVKSHDSLARIAHLNHTSVAKLKTANNLNSDLLHIGQKLVIPAATTAPATAIAATNPDTSVSTTAPTTSASAPLTATSGSAPIKPVTTIAKTGAGSPAPVSGHNVYTVVKGDTLTKIAHKFKTTPTALMTANDIRPS